MSWAPPFKRKIKPLLCLFCDRVSVGGVVEGRVLVLVMVLVLVLVLVSVWVLVLVSVMVMVLVLAFAHGIILGVRFGLGLGIGHCLFIGLGHWHLSASAVFFRNPFELAICVFCERNLPAL